MRFFLNNDNDETPGTVVLEAFKAYIRGVLISIGVWVKRERTKKKESLIVLIHQLEQTHKASSGNNKSILHQLILIREELKDLLEKEAFLRL